APTPTWTARSARARAPPTTRRSSWTWTWPPTPDRPRRPYHCPGRPFPGRPRPARTAFLRPARTAPAPRAVGAPPPAGGPARPVVHKAVRMTGWRYEHPFPGQPAPEAGVPRSRGHRGTPRRVRTAALPGVPGRGPTGRLPGLVGGPGPAGAGLAGRR